MGQRLLKLSTVLLMDVLKGLGEGPPRYFQVVKDAIPLDAKMVECSTSPYWPDTIDVVLESAAWQTEEPLAEIWPTLTTVEVAGE